jgi:hypothetical protein
VSATCDRFAREGLAQLEEGAALDPHFAACTDCGAQRRAYATVLGALGRPRDAQPAPGWEERVFEQVAARGRRRGPGWLRRGALFAVAAAAAVAAPFLWGKRAADPAAFPLRLAVEVVADPNAQLRGQSARAGDRLALWAQVPTGQTAELRVWRDEAELVLRCPGAERCRRAGAELTGELQLPSVGRYHALVVSSSGALAPPLPRFDQDAAALLEAGAQVEVAEPVDVY